MFGAMTADHHQRLAAIAEKAIELRDRSAADERDAIVEPSRQPVEQRHQRGIDRDIAGPISKIDQRAVEIEEEAGAVEQAGGRRREIGGGQDRKSTRLNSSHYCAPRMPSSA